LSAGVALCAAAARTPNAQRATGVIRTAPWPYLPGTLLSLNVAGFAPPYDGAVLGEGSVLPGGTYAIPSHAAPGRPLLVAGNATGLAAKRIEIAPPPQRGSVLIVASYDQGLIFHDARHFGVLGVLGTGGTPSDVAALDGRVAATDTQGNALTLVRRSPWDVARVQGVAVGDEVAFDQTSGDVFVTDRDVDGSGALTRVKPHGSVARVSTGATAEGLAIDPRRQIVYVANVNDGTVAAVEARTMRVVRRFRAVDRVFSLALSPDGTLLYAVSNQSADSPFAAPGAVVALSLRTRVPKIVARSAPLTFPLGIALDARRERLYVTDESLGEIEVLDARTLRPAHAPIRTCAIPWKPSFDPTSERLYVPCAGADAVDVVRAGSLRRVAGAPFRTGSYPLAVAIWHSPGKIVRRRELQRAAR